MASLNDLLGQPLSSLSLSESDGTLSLTDLLEKQVSMSKVMPQAASTQPVRIEKPI